MSARRFNSRIRLYGNAEQVNHQHAERVQARPGSAPAPPIRASPVSRKRDRVNDPRGQHRPDVVGPHCAVPAHRRSAGYAIVATQHRPHPPGCPDRTIPMDRHLARPPRRDSCAPVRSTYWSSRSLDWRRRCRGRSRNRSPTLDKGSSPSSTRPRGNPLPASSGSRGTRYCAQSRYGIKANAVGQGVTIARRGRCVGAPANWMCRFVAEAEGDVHIRADLGYPKQRTSPLEQEPRASAAPGERERCRPRPDHPAVDPMHEGPWG